MARTVDYMDSIMHLPEVEPYWYQIPFDFPNNLSQENKTLKVWDDEAREKWIHPLADIGIHESPIDVSTLGRDDAFYKLIKFLPTKISDKNCAVLVGMRMSESPRRRMTITSTKAQWHGITWCSKDIKNTRKFWPIYDFSDDDIWTAIAKNRWQYNVVYDYMYRYGAPKKMMRVSALIHETAWYALRMLQEFEPKTYNRFVARIPGTSTFKHTFDESEVIPQTLPFAFKNWKEYRDYLLEKICPADDKEIYIKRWQGQDGDKWYKIHVKEVILNDTCGTINDNYKYQVNSEVRLGGKYKERHMEQMKQYFEGKDGN